MFDLSNKEGIMKGISFRSMTMAVIVAVLCSVSLLWAQTAEDISACAPRIAKPRIMSVEECREYAMKEYNLLLSFEKSDTANYNILKDAKIADSRVYKGFDENPFATEFILKKNNIGVMTIVICMRSEREPHNVLDGGRVLTTEVLKRYPGVEARLTHANIGQWIDTLRAKGYTVEAKSPYRLYYFENLVSHFFVVLDVEKNGQSEEIVIDLYRGFIQDINPEWKTLEDLKKAQIDFKPAPMPEIPGF